MTEQSEPRVFRPRIVAFTKDWDDVPTCTTHVLREMGKAMPVLWVSSIGTRKPSLAHPSHAGRLARRLASGFKRAEWKENELRVLHPLLVPKAQGRVARWLNRRLFAWQVRRELRDMGDGPVEYWCFVPNAVDLLGLPLPLPLSPQGRGNRFPLPWGERGRGRGRTNESTNRRIIVYYCVDDWSKFRYLDTDWISRKEREMVAAADVVFTPARYLENKMRSLAGAGTPVHYVPHGVEYEKFRAALGLDPPAEISSIAHPIVGFYGNIYPWVDLELVRKLATARPEWSFVMIGGMFCDVSKLEVLPNVHFLGRREHHTLPAYCSGFDVAMIPYDLTDSRMESVNPVKTRELLAAGVPIVASDVPELRSFDADVLIARTPEEWQDALARQVARSDREAVSGRVAGDDWGERVRGMRVVVEAWRCALL